MSYSLIPSYILMRMLIMMLVLMRMAMIVIFMEIGRIAYLLPLPPPLLSSYPHTQLTLYTFYHSLHQSTLQSQRYLRTFAQTHRLLHLYLYLCHCRSTASTERRCRGTSSASSARPRGASTSWGGIIAPTQPLPLPLPLPLSPPLPPPLPLLHRHPLGSQHQLPPVPVLFHHLLHR